MTNDPKNGERLMAMPAPDEEVMTQYEPDQEELDQADEVYNAPQSSPDPNTQPATPLHDSAEYLKQLGETPAVYVNYFLSMFTPEGIRIAFGEAFGSNDQGAAIRHSIFINLETALKLHGTLSQSIQAIMTAKQQQMQMSMDMLMGRQLNPNPAQTQPGPPPDARKA